jgi:hypothetical protein
MAQERDSTPEKQLLKIIESKDSKDAPAQKQAMKRKGLSFFSFGAWRGRASSFGSGIGKGLKGGIALQLDIRAINKGLIAVMIALIGYLGFSLHASIKNVSGSPALKFQIKDVSKASNFPESTNLKAMSYYTEKVLTRNIFKMGLRKIEAEEVIVERPVDVLGDVAGHLRLVGISWSNNPDAMIEDTNNRRTFFVRRGQMVGELKVQAIFKDRVILMYKDTEVELK